MTIPNTKVTLVIEVNGEAFSYEFPNAQNTVLDSVIKYGDMKPIPETTAVEMPFECTEMSLTFDAFKDPTSGKWCSLNVQKPESEVNPLESAAKLIVDMVAKSASRDEINRAIQYSKAVLDSAKSPGMDLWDAYIEHGISALQEEYQGDDGDV